LAFPCVTGKNADLLESKHLIASCSKVFAALSVGILIDRETLLHNGDKLTWNTKIKDVLPDWRLMDKRAEKNADIEDVLCELSMLILLNARADYTAMQLGIPVNNAAWG
jgi:CubicO group peptidase (beta-lactamase class C family)